MKRCINNITELLNQYNIPICLFGLYVLMTHAMGLQNCVLKIFIGYPCPGCGMTRAMLALLQLDFVKAFQYNPFIFAVPFVILGIAFKHTSFVKRIVNNKWLCFTAILIVLVAYVLRWFYVYPNPPMDYFEHNLLAMFISLFH